MSNEDWEYVKNQINHYLGIQLKCDEHLLTLRITRISELKLAIVFYVNGKFKGEWLMNDCEERKRFFRPVNKSVYTAKQKKGFKKLGKRYLKQNNFDPDKKITYYQFYWTNFNSLKQHLIKNNTNIKLVK